ncbi:ARF GTPase-activating protein GIT2-like [Lytechinus variegatus]|uniref:ARF GTPase-activating protein GIT2-like n=1 Tax=Lytechinus variegatus TaxID=7654 RepID=UPI001BB1B743|nr:ARF GTPase-activating protein GIT2-like [Lytechinus variegatus]
MRGKQRSPGEICADCGMTDPGWASLNRGVLICDECCSVHRSLGRHISQIRALPHGPPWPRSLYEMVHALVSNGANSIWEHSLLDPSQVRSGKKKPNPKDSVHPFKSDFIRAKYQRLDFVHRLKDGDEATVKDLSRQLHSSVRTGNLETCLRLLSLGGLANFYHAERCNTPLHVAAKEGQMLQCELLIVYGADPGALDSDGQTPADLAKDEGHLELAERLIQCQYELTDRLTFFVCGKRPDHSSSTHFLIPELADGSLDRSDAADQARKKLQSLSNHLFEELAMDVYDEVDRRELDSLWVSLNKPSLVGGDRSVPFLPLNPELSATRNQGRQKLARFSAREFATLIIDILKEAKRRQQGNLTLSRHGDQVEIVREPPPIPPAPEKSPTSPTNIASCIEDNEPLYDSVCSDDDYGDVAENANLKNGGNINCRNHSNQNSMSAASSELSDGQVSMEEYLEMKKKLSTSESRVQQLLTMNKQLNQDVHMLQSMVDKLKEENAKLLVLQRGKDAPKMGKHRDLESLPPAPKPGPKPSVPGNRPISMFEQRATQKPAPRWKPSGPKANPTTPAKPTVTGSEGVESKDAGKDAKNPVPIVGLPTIPDDLANEGADSKDKPDRPLSETGSEYDNALLSQTEDEKRYSHLNQIHLHRYPSHPLPPNSPATISTPPPQSSSSPEPEGGEAEDGAEPKKPPTQEAVVGTTEKITRRIQTLLLAAQEGKLDRFVSCSDNIYATVTDMVELFPEKPKSEEVRVPLRLLVSSASRLRVECQSAIPADPSMTPDLKHLTNQIIACAYDIAKAAKQLVTSFQ